jgi:hypothetical protein
MSDPADETTTLTDDEVTTHRFDSATVATSDDEGDVSDTTDDAGDVADTTDTGDDSGDATDVTDDSTDSTDGS